MHDVEVGPLSFHENFNGTDKLFRVRSPAHDQGAVGLRLAQAVDLAGVAELAVVVLCVAAGVEVEILFLLLLTSKIS
jgi:hypothetical protein